jgi:1,3,6,8-tetrahydroxynaphthalene synthase
MPKLCRPAIKVPPHTISKAELIDVCKRLYPTHPELDLLLKIIENTSIKKRHILQPLEESLKHPGVEFRHKLYEKAIKEYSVEVVKEALKNAKIDVSDVDMIIGVSCTGFLFPPITSYLINEMNFNKTTIQLPIAQLGCAAGGASINRAYDFCLNKPDANVLIVCAEFCSLIYQPTDQSMPALISDALFGDAVTALVMKSNGDGVEGINILGRQNYLIPGTEKYISYDVRSTGFHFLLDKRVRETMYPVAPIVSNFLEDNNTSMEEIKYCLFHAGGPKILNDLVKLLKIDNRKVLESRKTLANFGNIASVFLIANYLSVMENEELHSKDKLLLAGFGPGITAEITLAEWSPN